MPGVPVMAVAHPDDKRVLVGGGQFFHVVTVGRNMKEMVVRTHETPLFISGFAVSPTDKMVLATGTDSAQKTGNPFVNWSIKAHIFEWD